MIETIAYDVELRRPGCAIVQRALGATINADALSRMNGWLVAPTPGMQVLPIESDEQLEQIILITNTANPERKE